VLTALQLVFVVSGVAGLLALASAYRWHPKVTRDGVIFTIGVAILLRGLYDARPEIIYSGGAIVGLVPTIRATLDKVRKGE
jgi:hypothetical protein